jgi:hypothetical protein
MHTQTERSRAGARGPRRLLEAVAEPRGSSHHVAILPRPLIIPLARKLDWRRPPLITLLLILANLLIYAVSEKRDEQSLQRAVRYFLHSPLAQIEPVRGVVEVLEAIQDEPAFLSLLRRAAGNCGR